MNEVVEFIVAVAAGYGVVTFARIIYYHLQ
jgi:hypothetical protein